MYLLGAKYVDNQWVFNIPIESSDISVLYKFEGTNEDDGGNYREIFLNGNDGERISVNEYTVIRFSGQAIALKSDGSTAKTFILEFVVKRLMTGITAITQLRHDLPETYSYFDIVVDETETQSHNEIVLKVKNPDNYSWVAEGILTEINN